MNNTNSGNEEIVGIWPVLVQTYGFRSFFGQTVGIVHSLLQFINPIILNLLIEFIRNKEEPNWKGYFYVAILFLCNLVIVVSGHIFLHQMVIVSLQMRSSLISTIYRKSLKLSNKARSKFTVGEITNYISVDVERIQETIPFLPNIIMCPLIVILAMYLLYKELGISALGGIIVLVILIPINVWTTKKCEQLEEEQLEAKDSR